VDLQQDLDMLQGLLGSMLVLLRQRRQQEADTRLMFRVWPHGRRSCVRRELLLE
jgi:hypothetical protein